MSDWNDLVKVVNSQGKLPLVLIQYPTGKWGFAGSIPIELCHQKQTLFGEQWTSNSYDTEVAARVAAQAINATISN